MHDPDINVTALVKGKEKYFFFYRDDQREDVLLKFGQFASHPELKFNWFDCAHLSAKVRAEQRMEARRP